jgi:hypothetical protein
MEQKRIGPATRSDPFGARRRFPSTPATVKAPKAPKKIAPQNPPTEAAQPEG